MTTEVTTPEAIHKVKNYIQKLLYLLKPPAIYDDITAISKRFTKTGMGYVVDIY